MDQKIMYAFRGWIAFVAFTDLGVAFRSFLEKKCILGEYSLTRTSGLLEQGIQWAAAGLAEAGGESVYEPTSVEVAGSIPTETPASFPPIARIAPSSYDPTLPRVLGMYSVLKAIALIHCTLFIHYIPVISMAICSILLTILMYLTEALYFQSATLNFYIVFPCVLNCLTLIGLFILPTKYLNAPTVAEDENAELLRQATAFKKRKQQPKKFS